MTPLCRAGVPLPLVMTDVAFAYGTRQVLRGVSIQVAPGELLGIAGPNGAGKTTMLHLLTGYLVPDSGSAELGACPLSRMKRSEVAEQIAYVPQRSDCVFPFLVIEVVMMGRLSASPLLPADSPEDILVARDALEDVGMADAAERRFDQLSGGERQLVLIARAFAQQSPFLVLDEPTTFLDLRRQRDIMRLLDRKRQEGLSIVATFHDLNLAARWADRLLLLAYGKVAACGPPEEVLREELLYSVYGVELHVEKTAAGYLRVDVV